MVFSLCVCRHFFISVNASGVHLLKRCVCISVCVQCEKSKLCLSLCVYEGRVSVSLLECVWRAAGAQ